MNTIETCEAMLEGKLNAFIGLGGNFMRAVPDSGATRRRGAAKADRADLDQAQSQPSRPRPAGLDTAVPRAHRNRRTGDRSTGRVHRR